GTFDYPSTLQQKRTSLPQRISDLLPTFVESPASAPIITQSTDTEYDTFGSAKPHTLGNNANPCDVALASISVMLRVAQWLENLHSHYSFPFSQRTQ
ncbi:hypothetical protein PIB30_091475, partial [Stylosanthes scabra]|nr:hypothetical protein [Stylosanthes scabra]